MSRNSERQTHSDSPDEVAFAEAIAVGERHCKYDEVAEDQVPVCQDELNAGDVKADCQPPTSGMHFARNTDFVAQLAIRSAIRRDFGPGRLSRVESAVAWLGLPSAPITHHWQEAAAPSRSRLNVASIAV
jgi:hypothetical protein